MARILHAIPFSIARNEIMNGAAHQTNGHRRMVIDILKEINRRKNINGQEPVLDHCLSLDIK